MLVCGSVICGALAVFLQPKCSILMARVVVGSSIELLIHIC